jgi:heme/copper-type cytochrome/quinol oxidase subunit 2
MSGLLGLLCVLCVSSSAWAEHNPGWGKWWLPPDRSTHGYGMDALFLWIFWITMIIFIIVELVLLVFLIKYRSRPERKKAFFTHGNPKLEMTWTIAPAIILALLALFSKKVWDQYRYAEVQPNAAKILVIGEQFKWNIIYPGPDGKLGRYLLYPKPTDPTWPIGADGQPVTYQGTIGPSALPYDKAIAAINAYIAAENPLGKDFTDPDGKDDDYKNALARKLFVPVGRQVEVQLSSKDVIHDFFLPNHRVKLDAVPGMRGKLHFTATMTSSERSEAKAATISIKDLGPILEKPEGANYVIIIDEKAPGTDQNKGKDTRGWRYLNPSTPRTSIIRPGPFKPDAEGRKKQLEDLAAAGLTDLRVTSDSGEWELVCEELCGQGHNTMHTPMVVLRQAEYDKLSFDKPGAPAPTTGPAVAVNDVK